MALNLLETYDVLDCSADLRLMHFHTFVNNEPVLLRAHISNQNHILMPEVYNLAFGAPSSENETNILDDEIIAHDDLDKMLSTILLFAYTYLNTNPDHYLGVDGSCDKRALLYFRKIKSNYNTLNNFFKVIAGVKYYVRFKRFSKPNAALTPQEQLQSFAESIQNNLDLADIQPLPEDINESTAFISLDRNYNYFIFRI